MSAKIYSVPSELKDVPNIWNDENYNELIEQWRERLKQWCKKRNPNQNQNYIGETVKWQVADGYAEYMVASLRPLELIHLPIMDEYSYQDADLQTVKRIKDQIDGAKRLEAFLNREPDEADIQEAIDRLGIETTKMSNAEITAKLDDKGKSWDTPFFFVRWDGISYLIPRFNHGTDNHEVFKYLVNKCEAHLVE